MELIPYHTEPSDEEGNNSNPYINVLETIFIMVVSEKKSINGPPPHAELDIHANMVVLGRNVFVFDRIHVYLCGVEPSYPSIGTSKHITIVYAAIK